MVESTITTIQARIHEIEERLRELEACEMTEGGLSSDSDLKEETQLYQERERLLRQISATAA